MSVSTIFWHSSFHLTDMRCRETGGRKGEGNRTVAAQDRPAGRGQWTFLANRRTSRQFSSISSLEWDNSCNEEEKIIRSDSSGWVIFSVVNRYIQYSCCSNETLFGCVYPMLYGNLRKVPAVRQMEPPVPPGTLQTSRSSIL